MPLLELEETKSSINYHKQYVDISFPIDDLAKTNISTGYYFYSAVKKLAPWLLTQKDARISPLRYCNSEKAYKVVFRLRVDLYPKLLALAGSKLGLANDLIRLGMPTVKTLIAKPSLSSTYVTIKINNNSDLLACDFLAVAEKRLYEQGISGRISILVKNGKLARKTLKVKNTYNRGFSVIVSGLSLEDSYKLQVLGLGGKQYMGAGWFW